MTATWVLAEVLGKYGPDIFNACAKVYPHVRTLLVEKAREPPGGGGAILGSLEWNEKYAIRSNKVNSGGIEDYGSRIHLYDVARPTSAFIPGSVPPARAIAY